MAGVVAHARSVCEWCFCTGSSPLGNHFTTKRSGIEGRVIPAQRLGIEPKKGTPRLEVDTQATSRQQRGSLCAECARHSTFGAAFRFPKPETARRGGSEDQLTALIHLILELIYLILELIHLILEPIMLIWS